MATYDCSTRQDLSEEGLAAAKTFCDNLFALYQSTGAVQLAKSFQTARDAFYEAEQHAALIETLQSARPSEAVRATITQREGLRMTSVRAGFRALEELSDLVVPKSR